MSQLTIVYLVEDHTDDNPKPHTVYFAHVYVSRSKAKVGVGHWVERGGHGQCGGKNTNPSLSG
jgi:hypothetical protein